MSVYEYLIVVHVHETNWASIRNLPEGSRPEQTWTHTYHIWRPNAKEAEQRSATTTSQLTLFNELGQDGWKLMTTDIPDSTVSNSADLNYFGWTEIGIPVRQRWTFMREVRS